MSVSTKSLFSLGRLLTAVMITFMVATSSTFAADGVQKIGVVDYASVFQRMPETKAAEQTLQTARNQTTTELTKMQTDFQNSLNAYLKEKSGLSKAVQDQREKTLQTQEQNLRKAVADKQAALNKREQELTLPINQKIGVAVTAVAQRDGYSLIVGSQSVVYGEPQYDITAKVLDQLKIK